MKKFIPILCLVLGILALLGTLIIPAQPLSFVLGGIALGALGTSLIFFIANKKYSM